MPTDNLKEIPIENLKEIPIKKLAWNKYTGMALFKTTNKLEEYIEELQINVMLNGIRKPPIVRDLKDGTYKVLQGNHRCEVAKNLEKKKILCEVKNV